MPTQTEKMFWEYARKETDDGALSAVVRQIAKHKESGKPFTRNVLLGILSNAKAQIPR